MGLFRQVLSTRVTSVTGRIARFAARTRSAYVTLTTAFGGKRTGSFFGEGAEKRTSFGLAESRPAALARQLVVSGRIPRGIGFECRLMTGSSFCSASSLRMHGERQTYAVQPSIAPALAITRSEPRLRRLGSWMTVAHDPDGPRGAACSGTPAAENKAMVGAPRSAAR